MAGPKGGICDVGPRTEHHKQSTMAKASTEENHAYDDVDDHRVHGKAKN